MNDSNKPKSGKEKEPVGETVVFFREDMFYPLTLSGIKPTAEECADHALCNPGTLRIESLDGSVVHWPEGTKH
jgi:hypothetical protein